MSRSKYHIEERKRNKIYFTSDLHLNHANIMFYCKRPFKNVEEMDNTIIQNFKDTLRSGDVLYILGDLTFKREYAIKFFEVLVDMGVECHFIIGNHDLDGRTIDIIKKYCSSVQNIKEIRVGGTHIVLSHYPMQAWNKSFHGSWQLFGHVHGRMVFETKQYDVGVDYNNFKPISFSYLQNIMKYGLTNKQ